MVYINKPEATTETNYCQPTKPKYITVEHQQQFHPTLDNNLIMLILWGAYRVVIEGNGKLLYVSSIN